MVFGKIITYQYIQVQMIGVLDPRIIYGDPSGQTFIYRVCAYTVLVTVRE